MNWSFDILVFGFIYRIAQVEVISPALLLSRDRCNDTLVGNMVTRLYILYIWVTYCRVLGQSLAACSLYWEPRIYLFHR